MKSKATVLVENPSCVRVRKLEMSWYPNHFQFGLKVTKKRSQRGDQGIGAVAGAAEAIEVTCGNHIVTEEDPLSLMLEWDGVE